MRRWMERHGGTVAALAAGLALRLLFAWKHPRFDGDTLIYGDIAKNLLQHHVYGLTENVVRPTLIRLPGYPLFLAGCFAVFGVDHYGAVVGVQVVLGLLTCVLVGDVARRMFGERAGPAALWASCLCPFTANYDAAALAESCSLFCVALALCGLERWARTRELKWAGVVGVACAWAVLLRPDEGLLAAAVVGAMAVSGGEAPRRHGGHGGFTEGIGGRLKAAGLAAVIVALPLGVWAGRNWRVFHVVEPLAPKYANDPGEFVSRGFYRWYRTWGVEYVSTANTYWLWDGAAISMRDLPARAVDDAAERAATAKAYADYNDQMSATAPVDAEFGAIARARERRHPLRTLVAMPVARVADMWLRPRTEFMGKALDWWRWRAHPRWTAFCAGYAGLNLLYVLAALAGLWRWRAWWRDPAGLAMVGFVVLRTAMLLTIDNSEPRYTIECFPVLFVLAAALWRRARAQ